MDLSDRTLGAVGEMLKQGNSQNLLHKTNEKNHFVISSEFFLEQECCGKDILKNSCLYIHSFQLSCDGKLTSVGADLAPLLRNGQLKPCVSVNLPSFIWREFIECL